MEIFYCIAQDTNEPLLSNLSKEMLKSVVDSPVGFKCETEKGIKMRKEKVLVENGWMFLCVYDNDITNKYFHKYLDFLKSLYESICNIRKDYTVKYEDKVRRYRHNINGYVAKIQDELGNVIPSSLQNNKNDWKTKLNQLKECISQNNDLVTQAVLHIYKNIQLIKAEMEVYDIMNSETANMNIIEHSIRKVVDLSVQSFFLDMLDKNVKIKCGLSSDRVLIDFPTISVALGHILDNAVKYTAENSTLDIAFENLSNTVKIKFAMTSILVKNEEVDSIFIEKYSGYWASEYELKGHGIGMYYAKKLIELNKGSIQFIAGNEKYKFDGIPYADNEIIIELPKVISQVR